MQKTFTCTVNDNSRQVSLRTMCNAIFYKDLVEPDMESFDLLYRYLNTSVNVLINHVSTSLEITLSPPMEITLTDAFP